MLAPQLILLLLLLMLLFLLSMMPPRALTRSPLLPGPAQLLRVAPVAAALPSPLQPPQRQSQRSRATSTRPTWQPPLNPGARGAASAWGLPLRTRSRRCWRTGSRETTCW